MTTDTDTPNAYQLANTADISSPDSLESPGAEWLDLVHQVARELIDDLDTTSQTENESSALDYLDDLQDQITERADQVVPIYTYNLWSVFVDLAAYQEDITDWSPQNEMENQARLALFLIAERLIVRIVEEEKIDREEMEEIQDEILKTKDTWSPVCWMAGSPGHPVSSPNSLARHQSCLVAGCVCECHR